LLAKQLALARDHLCKKRADGAYEVRCSGVFSSAHGMPCCHEMVVLEEENRPLQLRDFHKPLAY
jgi:hypothetical protein